MYGRARGLGPPGQPRSEFNPPSNSAKPSTTSDALPCLSLTSRAVMVQPQEMMSTFSRSDCSWNFSTVPAPEGRSPNTALVTEAMGESRGRAAAPSPRNSSLLSRSGTLLEKRRDPAQTPPLPCLDLESDHSCKKYPLATF